MKAKAMSAVKFLVLALTAAWLGNAAAAVGPAANDDPLITLIKQQQSSHVRESWGTEDWQCFTWDNYREFESKDVPGLIEKSLAKDEKFAAMVAAIRQQSTEDRNKLLSQAAGTFKLTWAQLGRISREGQTDAGQKAEQMIAQAIVELVKRSL